MWIDIVFYIVFLSQVLLISYYYPKKLLTRNDYVLKTYPSEKYPKLYDNTYYAKPELVIKKVLNRYKYMNFGIGFFGISLFIAMAMTGYAPRHIKENEDLIFVMFFGALQMVPYIYIEISTMKWSAHIRAAASSTKRSAELTRRRLFDFISPSIVALAIALFFAWLVFFIVIHSEGMPWQWNQYVTVIMMSGINILFAAKIFMTISGRKIDPHQASQDQRTRISAIIKVHVFASIGMSVFLIIMELVNTYHLDLYEPLFLSLYIQSMVFLGIGQIMRTLSIKNINFDVYKAEAS